MERLEEQINAILVENHQPMERVELCAKLQTKPAVCEKVLHAMQEQGRIVYTNRGKIALPEQMGYVRGTISANERGFAFLVQESRDEEDLFLPAIALHGALHGDTVLVRKRQKRAYRGKEEGEVTAIIRRARQTVIGRLEKRRQMGMLYPEDRRLPEMYVPGFALHGAKNGDLVVARVTHWPAKNRSWQGEITEVLGKANCMDSMILGLIRSYELPTEFAPAALAQAKAVEQSVSPRAKKNREDFRDLLTVTIDGEDARDFDDAISICPKSGGEVELYVHIADVSHYVKLYDAIDRDAYERGTSVYFPDRVLPMLPRELSNGICSLNEGEDRLALSCVISLSAVGEVLDYRFCNSVICSNRRCTYESVNRILQHKEEIAGYTDDIVELLRMMDATAQKLMRLREERGSIDFDIPDCKIQTDAQGNATCVEREERGPSQQMIEEFMLCANECAAKLGKEHNLPFLYRVHENPETFKLESVFQLARALGLKVPKSEHPTPKELQALLQEAAQTPFAAMFSRLLLRAMQKAHYAEKPLGHYGLALKNYCHFTSPIRRYPDLMVHRAIKAFLLQRNAIKEMEILHAKMPEYALHTSERERVAMEAERAVDDLLKAQYMERYIGKRFVGIVSSVVEYGLFVELENTVEGLVRITTMADDTYLYDEKRLQLKGWKTKKTFAIGDKIDIIVNSVDLELRRIDFLLAEEEELHE